MDGQAVRNTRSLGDVDEEEKKLCTGWRVGGLIFCSFGEGAIG